MLARLLPAILFCLIVTAQEISPLTPEQSLRRIIRQVENLTQEERKALLGQVHPYPSQCALASALFPQEDHSRVLVAIASTLDKPQKATVRVLMEQLVETKVNTLLCDTVLDQLGLYSARRPRYDRVMGMMLAYSLPKALMQKALVETTVDGFPVIVAKLNDQDILQQFHEQGPAADPTAISANRNRLRNAITKQIAREMLGFLQQGKYNTQRLQDARRCLEELAKIKKTRQENYPADGNSHDKGWNAKPLMDAAAYCLVLADGQTPGTQDTANEAFFTMTDTVAELPPPWFDIVREYAIRYNRKQDYDFLMSNSN